MEGSERPAEDERMEIDEENDADQPLDSDEEGGLRVDDDIYIPPPARKMTEVNTTGPRLVITHIVNENFKSYAGKVTIGPFNKCFSAIIGPNGSGKSNVIDSMLFVFGYRATKIRCKKTSVLIHNSSEHPNIRSCKVSVHFARIVDKDENEADVVENSEFAISRTAFKDNSTFYELNGRKVHFKEIGKLLRSHGVDLDHNRFLILQGEVEQIALMKPKAQNEHETGMLEFLEDIMGTNRYKVPLEKLNEKVEILSERRMEKMNRVKAAEKEKEELEGPMNEVVQFLRMENTITKLRHKSLQFKRFELAGDIENQQKKVDDFKEDSHKLVQELETCSESEKTKTALIKEKRKKWEALEKEKEEIAGKYNKIKKKDDELREELQSVNKRRKDNKANIEKSKSLLEELKCVPETNQKKITEIEGAFERHKAQHEKEKEMLDNLRTSHKDKLEPLVKQRKEHEANLAHYQKDVDKAKAELNVAQSELDLYVSSEETEKNKLQELKESLREKNDWLKENKEQVKQLSEKIPATERSLKDAEKKLNELQQQELEINRKLNQQRGAYEQRKAAQAASTSKNRIVNALMQQKREGNIPGIFGRLGDLGGIDSKYDVAVSTACFPLDNIIVDTADTAQLCIEYVRRKDLGRVTCIPLDKHQGLADKCRQKITTPENVLRLFDLIKVKDERVLPAFYYALKDTLVATNMEQATRIGYGARRWRVVTLNGELIETTGTMSGGGSKPSRGRMGQNAQAEEFSAGEMQKLQTELDDLYRQQTELRTKQPSLKEQVESLRRQLKDWTMDFSRTTKMIEGKEREKRQLQERLVPQERRAAETRADPAQVRKLTAARDALQGKLAKALESTKSLEEKVERINEEMEKISGGKMKAQTKKVAELQKMMDNAKSEIVKLEVEIKTADTKFKKTDKQIVTLRETVSACEARIMDGQKDKTELEEKAKEILGELERVNEALSERDDGDKSLVAEVKKLQERINKLKAVKIDLDVKGNEIEGRLHGLKAEFKGCTDKLGKLQLHVIPNENQEELPVFKDEELQEMDPEQLHDNLSRARERLPKTPPNMNILKEYLEKDRIYMKFAQECQEITDQRNNLRDIYDQAKQRRTEEFIAGFNLITIKLKEMYQMITLGGDAELELVDSLDPFSEGVVFSVRPPKKSWKNISNLSGGEKTLSSLALVFALHHYKPTPLYFMDEIDAALDFKNVSIVGHYIKERTKNAQFIVISLRSNMFELADFLVGIYKTFNATKSVNCNLATFSEAMPQPQQAMHNPYASQATRKDEEGLKPTQATSGVCTMESNEEEEELERMTETPKRPSLVQRKSSSFLEDSLLNQTDDSVVENSEEESSGGPPIRKRLRK